MASATSRTPLLQLGSLKVNARGKLGKSHAHATPEQMKLVQEMLAAAHGFSAKLEDCIICVEDRLYRNGQRKYAPRLAGGALSLGLMFHFLFGGEKLSDCLRELKRLGFYLVLHNDCGALKLAPTLIPKRLSLLDADGYTVLEALGLKTEKTARNEIAEWATSLPDDFFDIDACMGIVDEVEQIVGKHNAVLAAVSTREGESFVAGGEMSQATGGLLGFGFDPWAAEQAGLRMGVGNDRIAIAIRVAEVFTAEVLLELAADDLNIFVHE